MSFPGHLLRIVSEIATRFTILHGNSLCDWIAGIYLNPQSVAAVRRHASFPSIFRNVSLPFPPVYSHFSIMQSHELLREVFQKCSAKQVAAELGLSLSTIYKWAEPDDGTGSGTANPLDRIEALLRCTGDNRLVQWVCQRSGGFFILNPKADGRAHPHFLVPATNEIVQEFADLLAVIANAAHDNQVTPKEAGTIRERWEELKSVTECFVACCEGGDFSSMKQKHEQHQLASARRAPAP